MVLSDNFRGALFMVGSMTAFTINDACMKALSDELPLFQALVIRSLVVVTALALVAWRQGVFSRPVPRKDQWLIAIRTLSEVGGAYFFITALFNMPIANLTAILQALPLTVTLAGAVFLGEPVGWRRVAAIVVGFAGVLLIVRPPFLFGAGDVFTIYSVYALLAVACVTVRDIASRRITAKVPSLTVALAAGFGVLLLGSAGSMTQDWQPLSPLAAAQVLGASVFVIGGYIFSVSAMRSGEIGFVAPFRYTSLLTALVLGFLVFGEWPTGLTLLGASIVAASGLYTLWRERGRRRMGPALRIR